MLFVKVAVNAGFECTLNIFVINYQLFKNKKLALKKSANMACSISGTSTFQCQDYLGLACLIGNNGPNCEYDVLVMILNRIWGKF